MRETLFFSFRIEDHVPADHLLRSIDRFVDPELMIRMLLIGYCIGIRSERRLCEEVHLNLAYLWFRRRDLDGAVPGHSTLSKKTAMAALAIVTCGASCSR